MFCVGWVVLICFVFFNICFRFLFHERKLQRSITLVSITLRLSLQPTVSFSSDSRTLLSVIQRGRKTGTSLRIQTNGLQAHDIRLLTDRSRGGRCSKYHRQCGTSLVTCSNFPAFNRFMGSWFNSGRSVRGEEVSLSWTY